MKTGKITLTRDNTTQISNTPKAQEKIEWLWPGKERRGGELMQGEPLS